MSDQTLLTLLMDLHKDGSRQGPGSEATTRRALDLTRLDRMAELQVADIGCGTGASTLILARNLPKSQITAVDLFPEFLDILATRAQAAGVADPIEPLAQSMDALAFAPESLDLIWSEGAIYNLGFRKGLETFRPFLRRGGVLAVSEITWLRPDPPEKLRRHWQAEYPEIATASEKIAILEGLGFDLLGYFVLPPSDWIDNYYAPTAERMPAFLQRHEGQAEAAKLAAMEQREAALYRRYQDWFSYGFYIARRR